MRISGRLIAGLGSSLLCLLALAVAPAAQAATVTGVPSNIRISEVGPNGKSGNTYTADFIELTNSGAQDEDISGWILKDDDDAHSYALPSGSIVPAGGYLDVDTLSFGLGNPADAARLYESDGTTLVDEIYWNAASASNANSWNRCESSTGAWDVLDEPATPGAANECPSAADVTADLQSHIHVNEVMADESSFSPAADWIEVDNTGPATIDLSGWWLSDDTATHMDVLPTGTFIDPDTLYGGGPDGDPSTDLRTYDWWTVGNAGDLWGDDSTDFGLGKNGDNAALVFPNGSDDDRLVFGSDDGVTPAGNSSTVPAPPTDKSVGRDPDGGTGWQLTSTPTPGLPNQFGNPADKTVTISAIDSAAGTVTLADSADIAADVSGWVISHSAGSDTYIIPAGTTVPASGTLVINAGLSFDPSGDTVTLADGATTVATKSLSSAAPTGQDAIRLSEIETNGDENGDWVELTNISDSPVDAGGMVFDDNHAFPATNMYTVPEPTIIQPGGYYQIPLADADVDGGNIGLGAADQARIYKPVDGTVADDVLVDAVTWTEHESEATYDWCPGATPDDPSDISDSNGDLFINSWQSTPGAANVCTPSVAINEFDANGNNDSYGDDWVELTNFGSYPVNLSNWIITDDGNGDGDTITPTTATLAGSLDASGNLAPDSFVAYEVDSKAVFPAPALGKSAFGLGASGDEVRLYEPDAWTGGNAYDPSKLVDSVAWGSDAGATIPNGVTATLTGFTSWPASPATSWGRCSNGSSEIVADGTGAWAQTSAPTPGSPNQCAGLITSQPWPDSVSGQPVQTADNTDLGQNMSGLFYQPGATPAGDYIWGIQNGGSGLSGANPGDPGALYKLVEDGSGKWGPAPGWEKGVPLRYLNNATGEIDAEGVTAVDGKVYVTSERDNTNSDVSKIAVVEADPNSIVPEGGTLDGQTVADADGDLGATHEWDLGPVLGPGGTANTGLDASKPGDANLGLEGITFVPDAYLTSVGFKDQSTGQAYDPADYPKHVDGGLFFVALEKNGDIYAFAFNADNTYSLVATIPGGFRTIQELQWDPSQHALWAVCDNGCQGQSSLLKIDTSDDANKGTFQIAAVYQRPTGAVDNLNNEGFTVQPATECVNGEKTAFWSDDSDDVDASGDPHWLRTAAVDCTGLTSEDRGVTITATVAGSASPPGTYNAPVTVTFTCTDIDAVLTSVCPAPVTVSSTTAGFTAAAVTDTLGQVIDANVPAINILPAWTAASVYNTGIQVSYQGSTWQALWWTQNQTPGDPTGPWEQIIDNPDGTAVWTASRVFNAGDRATYQGSTWQALWYTRNQTPGDPNGPWEQIINNPDGTAVWTVTRVFNAGDKATYQGHLYQAQWYTRDQIPGAANGPWKEIS